MGYYDSPPIIQGDRSGEIIGQAIADVGKSIGAGVTMAAERHDRYLEKNRLTIEKLQEDRNKSELEANNKISKWNESLINVNAVVDAQLKDIVQTDVLQGADSNIALSTTVDKEKRGTYLKQIRDADALIVNSSNFIKSMATEITGWNNTKAITVGSPGGMVVNGATNEDILANTATLEILGGSTRYDDVDIKVTKDKEGTGVVLSVSGKTKDGTAFKKVINSNTYLTAEGSDNTLLSEVEDLTEFVTKSREGISDDKIGMFPGYLSQKYETVDLTSRGDSGGGIGGDQYQLVGARRVEENAVRSALREKSDALAAAMLSTDSPTTIKNMLNYTLKKQDEVENYYDVVFKEKTPSEQKAILSKALEDHSFKQIVAKSETTIENGKTIYWDANAKPAIKQKEQPVKAVRGDSDGDGYKDDKPDAYTYKESDYDDLIEARGRTSGTKRTAKTEFESRNATVKTLNKLSGKTSLYKTREQIEEEVKNMPYEDANGKKYPGQTFESYYKTNPDKGTFKKDFDSMYPSKNGYIYVEEGTGNYVGIKDYKTTTAEGRIRLALDQTANEGQRKMLQGKLEKAKLSDWMDSHPKSTRESWPAYAERARKQGFNMTQ